MSVKDIIENIKAQGKKEIESLRDYYNKKIEELKSYAKKQQEDFVKSENIKIESAIEEIKRGQLLTAKIEAGKIELSYKKKAIKDVLDYIHQNIISLLGEDEYYKFLKLVIEKYSDNNDVVKLNPNDIKLFKDRLLKDISKKVEYKEFNDYGVVIEKPQFNYNFSLKALIEQKYAELEKIIGKKLNVL
ncbi:MAG TPA: hypothetical protein PKW55_05420 [Spirochaetota bacterium]|nr:hypothetical protein [Spirochaetota bacterium]HOM37608.1 hypothetical protein [Spirochaetota bacterium]HPQ49421.1 hypothetical protein [Spirochaetota bacterium]